MRVTPTLHVSSNVRRRATRFNANANVRDERHERKEGAALSRLGEPDYRTPFSLFASNERRVFSHDRLVQRRALALPCRDGFALRTLAKRC